MEKHFPQRCRSTCVYKPGKDLNYIVNQIQPQRLNSDTQICIMAGTNDVFRTKFEDIKKSIDILFKKCQKFQILFVLTPPRYDNPRLNPHIVKMNVKLKHYFSKYSNFTFLDPHNFIQMIHYCSDGVHLNQKGKNVLCYKIIHKINNKVYKNRIMNRPQINGRSGAHTRWEREYNSNIPIIDIRSLDVCPPIFPTNNNPPSRSSHISHINPHPQPPQKFLVPSAHTRYNIRPTSLSSHISHYNPQPPQTQKSLNSQFNLNSKSFPPIRYDIRGIPPPPQTSHISPLERHNLTPSYSQILLGPTRSTNREIIPPSRNSNIPPSRNSNIPPSRNSNIPPSRNLNIPHINPFPSPPNYNQSMCLRTQNQGLSPRRDFRFVQTTLV